MVWRLEMRRTEECTSQLRDDILDEAIKIFSQKGYEATNMQDIADAVSMSRGPLYYHYKTKNELFTKTVERHMVRFVAQVDEIFRSDKPFIDKIYLDLVARLATLDFSECMQFTLGVNKYNQQFEQVINIHHSLLQQAYDVKLGAAKKAAQKGELKPSVTPKKCVDMIFICYGALRSSNSEVITLSHNGQDPINVAEVLDSLMRFLKLELLA
jgi:AcrR family transcriptional regulator